MTQDRSGLRFERQVQKTLKDIGINSYGEHGQIPLQALHPGSHPGGHLEIDIVCLIGNICILVETTIKSDDNSEKIKKFIRHCRLVVDSPLSKSDLFSLFDGIPGEELINFSGISDWRYLYIGKSLELITENITPERYPETDRLHIFNLENWEYFRMLARTIKGSAQFEFLASVDINPRDIGDAYLGGQDLTKRYLQLTNKTLFSGQTDILADLFVVTFKPDELLRIARVLRYQGQPMAISSETSTNQPSGGYQRILIPDKLKKIHEFVNDDPKVAFPTNLTLVLSNECKKDGSNLKIPSKYASIDIIDGQHRLFSYALSSEHVREEALLIATAIKFNTDDEQKINQYAARTFITINREQTKVKKDLLYLISYDVLGEKTPESIAAKILKECDSRNRLSRIFALSPFIKKNRFGQNPIPIISIVKEMARIFKPVNLDKIIFTIGELTDNSESEVLIKAGVNLLERHFFEIKNIFSDDWGNADSLLMCANYFGAFIRLLETFVDEQFTIDRIRQELLQIKQNVIERYSEGRPEEHTVVFYPNAFKPSQNGEGQEDLEAIPNKRDGIPKIYSFLNKNRN